MTTILTLTKINYCFLARSNCPFRLCVDVHLIAKIDTAADGCVNGWPLVQLQMKAGSNKIGAALVPRERGPDLFPVPTIPEVGVAPSLHGIAAS